MEIDILSLSGHNNIQQRIGNCAPTQDSCSYTGAGMRNVWPKEKNRLKKREREKDSIY